MAGRDILVAGLREAGLQVHDTSGTYFVVADIGESGDGLQFCLDLPERIGVAAIPVQVFCDDPGLWRSKVRFVLGKQHGTLHRGVERLRLLDSRQG